MKKIIPIIFLTVFGFFVFVFSTGLFANGGLSKEEEMQNIHATALLSLSNKNIKKAEKYFFSGGEIAVSIKFFVKLTSAYTVEDINNSIMIKFIIILKILINILFIVQVFSNS